MESEFERATAVERIDEGLYRGDLVTGWDISGNANGGYLMSVAARAMSDAVGRPPLGLTAHFVSPGPVAPVTVEVDVVREGRRMAVVRGTLRTEERVVITLLGTFAATPGTAGGPTDERVSVAGAPAMPSPADCLSGAPPVGDDGASGFGDRVVTLYHPDDTGFRVGEPTGEGLVRGWFEFADGAPVDAYGLLVVADAFAPVCFNVAGIAPSWAPTLELTTYIRGVPGPGPLQVRFATRYVRDGMFEEDGEIWDSTGRLVAQSRQLALLPRG